MNTEKWMAKIDDGQYLCSIAIPGTHDSACFDTNIWETQDWSIKKQLSKGIRFFDVRIDNAGWHQNYKYKLAHGNNDLGDFEKVWLKPVRDFLNKNPSETVLMSIKAEDTLLVGKGYISDFMENIINKEQDLFFAVSTCKTKLGDVRGKIVVLNRVGKKNCNDKLYKYGIEWPEKKYVSDDYDLGTKWDPFAHPDYNKKWKGMEEMLDEASEEDDLNLRIVFSSGYWTIAIPHIRDISEHILPKLKDYFADENSSKTCVKSIIVMDYPSSTVIEKIISNSRYTK